MSCTKQLTLSETSPAPEITRVVYYKCEEPSSDPAATPIHDEVSGIDMESQRSLGAGPIISIPGKIGNGFSFPSGGFPTSWQAVAGGNPAFNFSGKNFVVRLWSNPLTSSNLSVITALEAPTLWSIKYQAGSYVWRLNLTSGFVSVSATASASTWHRVLAWHEYGVGLGIKIDDDPIAFTAATDPVKNLNPSLVVADAGIFAESSYFDEFGIWTGALWTESQIDYDWNGGAGRTFPDVPGA